MRISVVIPTYNGARYIVQTVESVQAQTLEDWELVIVNDGSKDDTASLVSALAAREPRLRVVTQPNTGIAGARNRGFQEICKEAEYVIFLDHDDLWERQTLEVLARELDSAPSAVAAHGLAYYMDEEGCRIRPGDLEGQGRRRQGVQKGHLVTWPLDKPTCFANLVYSNCIMSTGSILIRRAHLEEAGSFDPRAVPADDYDMWLRLSRRGDFAFVDQVVLGYRQHPAMTSLDLRAKSGSSDYVRYKLITAEENTPEQRDMIRTGYRGCQRQIIATLRHNELPAAIRRGNWLLAAKVSRRMAIHAVNYLRGRPRRPRHHDLQGKV